AFAFVLLLEERFKTLTTLCITAIALVASFITSGVVGSMVPDPQGAASLSNMLCVFWLFVASIFSSSNNIAQKIFAGLLLITDYVVLNDVGTVMLGSLPINPTGFSGLLFGNLLYILFTLIITALFIKPLRYLYRRMISPYSIGLCLLQGLTWYVADGGLNNFLGVDDFNIRFVSVFVLYALIVFIARSVYGAARFKARDNEYASEAVINQVRAESYNSMVVNVESYKATKKNVVYAMTKLGSLAEQGRNKEIISYVSKFNDNPGTSPLLETYSENPYINALVATKAADAASKGIRVESNISIGDSRVKVIELCMLIDDVLTWTINDAGNSEEEDRFVRINVIPAKGQLAIETVHSTGEKAHNEKFHNRTFGSFFENAFELKDKSVEDLRNVREITQKHSGRISISKAGNTTITRIGINY
ncbi:MAG: hypothetical protein Q4C42_09170, partial [Clostridia bacterium]|nr:hypothetical protein [Clostridia bacterium]